MTNYMIMWQRDGDEGFDFIDAYSQEDAVYFWIKEQNGWHPHGQLFKMIIVETSDTTKVPLDLYDYYYGDPK